MSKTLIIFLALVGGLLIGIAVSGATQAIAIADVIGALWLNALRMTVVPLVVALLVTGIVQTAAAARASGWSCRCSVRRFGLRSLGTFREFEDPSRINFSFR